MRRGTDIRYAMSFPMENGGRRIVIITPRVIGFREASFIERALLYQRPGPRAAPSPYVGSE